MSNTVVTKGQIGIEDLQIWDGVHSTFTRLSSTGATLTLTRIGTEIDVLTSYGAGTEYTDASISAAISALGSNSAQLLLRPGTWTIGNNITIPSNIMLKIPFGTILSISTGKKLTINGTIWAVDYNQIFSGLGTVAFTLGQTVYSSWYPGSDTGAQINAATASLPHCIEKPIQIYGDGWVKVPPQPYNLDSVTSWTLFTKFSTTIVLYPGIGVDFNGARLQYTGSGTAITTAFNGEYKPMIKGLWITTDTLGKSGTTALLVNSAVHGQFGIENITNFEYGVRLRGDPGFTKGVDDASPITDGAQGSGGCSWNEFWIKDIYGTRYPVYCEEYLHDASPDIPGFITANKFHGKTSLIHDGSLTTPVGITLKLVNSPLGDTNNNSSYLSGNHFDDFDVEGWHDVIKCDGNNNFFTEIHNEGSTNLITFGAYALNNTVKSSRPRTAGEGAVVDASSGPNMVNFCDDEAWHPVTYAAGNFTAATGSGWTVDSGDQIAYSWNLVGKMLTVSFNIQNSSVITADAANLFIAIPAGFVAKYTMQGGGLSVYSSGWKSGTWHVVATGTVIYLYASLDSGSTKFVQTTNVTNVSGVVQFEIE